MELGLGVLEWTPGVFWSATPHELTAALNGWAEKQPGAQSSDRLTDDDVEELQAMLDDALREEGRI